MGEKYSSVGRVVQIIGPVMDIQFEEGHLPAIYNACRITSEGYNLPEPLDVTAEVQQHLAHASRHLSEPVIPPLTKSPRLVAHGGIHHHDHPTSR